MRKLLSDIVFAWGSIGRNRLHSVFTVLVSMFTCIFLNAVLQMADTVYGDNPPFSNADRIISLVTDEFKDTDGRYVDGIYAQYIPGFSRMLRSSGALGVSETESVLVAAGDNVYPSYAGFVSGHYWGMNDFEFVEGRSFTEDEGGDGVRIAVVTDEAAEKYFGKGSALGKELEVQGITYEVIGVVRNYSSLATVKRHIDVWLTSANTKFLPSGIPVYNLDILARDNVSKEEFRQDILLALKNFYRQRNVDLDLTESDLLTLKEQRIASFGDSGGLFIGLGVIIGLLLLIPAINIVTLNESGIYGRMQEFAVRRAMGATAGDIVKLVLTENSILVCIGFVMGFILTVPAMHLIERVFFNTGGMDVTILAGDISFVNMAAICAFAVVFSLISGGVPAWRAVRKSISLMLKGGDNDD